MAEQGAADGDALAFATGEMLRPACQQRDDAEPLRDADQLGF